MSDNGNEPFIVKGYRTASGKADKGGFRSMRSDDLAVAVIRRLLEAVPGLAPENVDDVIVGNAVPEAEQGLQMARWIALMALSKEVPGVTINRYCASGLEAIAMGHAKIGMGMADCIIAGGTESMSMVPMAGWKTAPNYNLARDHADYFLSMGLAGEEMARSHEISRQEQDAFAHRSHMNAVRAIDDGKFRDEIVPVEIEETYAEKEAIKQRKFVIDTDEGPRRDTSPEALAELSPVFKVKGTITAGNSSQRSDGAAFVILMSERFMKSLGIEPEARLAGCAVAGVHPKRMGIGPVQAVPKALKAAGLALDDIDLIELNEAFAAQSLAVMKDLHLDPDRTNVNGGAIALGHPLGCTGCKLTVQIIHELKRREQRWGLVTACVGGGQGIAGVIESL